MSAQGRPKRELLPLGGEGAQRQGSPMSVPRFFVPTLLAPDVAGHTVELPDDVAHHAVRVVRLAARHRADALRRHRRRICCDARAGGPSRCGGAHRRLPRDRARVAADRHAGAGGRCERCDGLRDPQGDGDRGHVHPAAADSPQRAAAAGRARGQACRALAAGRDRRLRAVRTQQGARRAAAAPHGRVACRVGRDGHRAGAGCGSLARRACPRTGSARASYRPEGGLDQRELAARARAASLRFASDRACCARRLRRLPRWPCCSRRGATGDDPPCGPARHCVDAGRLRDTARRSACRRDGSTRTSCSPRRVSGGAADHRGGRVSDDRSRRRRCADGCPRAAGDGSVAADAKRPGGLEAFGVSGRRSAKKSHSAGGAARGDRRARAAVAEGEPASRRRARRHGLPPQEGRSRVPGVQ